MFESNAMKHMSDNIARDPCLSQLVKRVPRTKTEEDAYKFPVYHYKYPQP